jgi:hypothetical protein
LGRREKNKTHFWPVAFKKMQRPKMSKDKPKNLSASELISQPYGASSGSCSSHRCGEKNAKIALNVKERPIEAFFSF